MNRSYARLVITSALLLILALALTGCGLLAEETRSVSDPDNLFHFKVPASWQFNSEQGFISLYAGEELPADGEPIEELSLLVFTSTEPTETAIPQMLDYLIDSRAEQRGWTEVEKGEPREVKVGGADGYSVDVSASNADGGRFDTRYFFTRTEDAEVFVVAVAPVGTAISEYDETLESVTTQWFWHDDSVGSAEETDTGRTP